MEYVRFTIRAHVPRVLWDSFEADCREQGETPARVLMQELWNTLDQLSESVHRSQMAECIWLDSQLEEGVEENEKYSKFWEMEENRA